MYCSFWSCVYLGVGQHINRKELNRKNEKNYSIKFDFIVS